MAVYYFDSSALVKRYVSESGSQWVEKIADAGADNRIHTVRISAVEVASAVSRRERGRSISAQDAARILTAFREDFERQYRKVNLWAAVVDSAAALAEKHGLRAYDAIHLAAAQAVRIEFAAVGLSVAFVSSDEELNQAARAEGFAVENPTDHS